MITTSELTGTLRFDHTDVVHDASIWAGVDRLIDRAPRDSDLWFHGLEHLAARRQRLLGREPSAVVIAAERTAAATSLIAPLVIERVLAAVDSRVVLMKGPEIAQWWQNPLARSYRDVDLLAEDAEGAWQAMQEAGFEQTGDPALYVGIHHLRPLVWPGLPLVVEVHSAPKWLEGSTPPTAELLRTAVPSSTGIPGLLAIEPARHAVAIAVHAWAHVPLSRLGRLIDVAAVAQGADRAETAEVARAWGVERVWSVTEAAIDSLLRGRRRPLAGHVWARHLWSVRERTVLERQLERWLGPFSMLPPARAARLAGSNLAHQLALESGETRPQMLRRSGRAAADAFTRLSEHDRAKDGRRQQESP